LKLKFKNPLKNTIKKARKFNFALTSVKGEVKENFDLGDLSDIADAGEVELEISCDGYHNTKIKKIALEDCNIRLKPKTIQKKSQKPSHSVTIDKPSSNQNTDEQ